MAPTLNSISPASGPPDTLVTLLGAGFSSGSQVGCPTLVATTLVDSGTLTCLIPGDIEGPAGTAVPVAVYVQNPDGSTSTVLMFSVEMLADKLQCWTTVDAVTGEVPGFQRGGKIDDAQILVWMRSVAQALKGMLLRRGLSLNPADWQQPGADASPEAVSVLEMINRLGAAARLAAAVSAQFSATGEWALSKNLRSAYKDECATLIAGDYDKLFRPSAATIESGPEFASGDMTNRRGYEDNAFSKEQVF